MITLKTLPQATAQEVFDQVAAHLLAQGRKSEIDSMSNNGCVYRGPDGTKCAAGCLISDDEYASEMEGKGWGALVRDGRAPHWHYELIRDLQWVHDVQLVSLWRQSLQEVAKKHGVVLTKQVMGE